MGKAAPLLLLAQRAHQRIETEGARQEDQQMNAPKLRGTETGVPPCGARAGKALVNEIVRDVCRKNAKQFGRANRRELHKQHATHLELLRPLKIKTHKFWF